MVQGSGDDRTNPRLHPEHAADDFQLFLILLRRGGRAPHALRPARRAGRIDHARGLNIGFPVPRRVLLHPRVPVCRPGETRRARVLDTVTLREQVGHLHLEYLDLVRDTRAHLP